MLHDVGAVGAPVGGEGGMWCAHTIVSCICVHVCACAARVYNSVDLGEFIMQCETLKNDDGDETEDEDEALQAAGVCVCVCVAAATSCTHTHWNQCASVTVHRNHGRVSMLGRKRQPTGRVHRAQVRLRHFFDNKDRVPFESLLMLVTTCAGPQRWPASTWLHQLTQHTYPVTPS